LARGIAYRLEHVFQRKKTSAKPLSHAIYAIFYY
jgi:hypothetical protein